jgi:DNA-binding Lrp family transcriptional regulator
VRRRWPGPQDGSGAQAKGRVEDAAAEDEDEAEYGDLGNDPKAVGLAFEALLFVTMRQEDRDTLLGFEAALTAIPNVVQAQRLFGDPDYLLRIVTADLAAYQQLEDDTLAALPGVQRLNSTLVMKQVVNDRPLPA